jgi:hypothetical protein
MSEMTILKEVGLGLLLETHMSTLQKLIRTLTVIFHLIRNKTR